MCEFNIGDKFRNIRDRDMTAEVISFLGVKPIVVIRAPKADPAACDIDPFVLLKNWVRVPREPDGWINVYPGNCTTRYKTRKHADRWANDNERIACVPYYEGQGLELEKKDEKKNCDDISCASPCTCNGC